MQVARLKSLSVAGNMLTTRLFLFVLVARWSAAQMDLLQPFGTPNHGPVNRRLSDSQKCQHKRFGNSSYSLHKAHSNPAEFGRVVDVKYQVSSVASSRGHYNDTVSFRYQRVYNPERTFSVLEPGGRPGGCDDAFRTTVQEAALTGSCLVAANAGFFDTHTGHCKGNIVSDGRLVQDSGGIQNVHFGVTKDGQIFTGYLSEIELKTLQFQQLVGGVIWLLRDGQTYINESLDMECPETQELGTLEEFVGTVSARTALGHDAVGRILMIQLDGKSHFRGVNLHDFAEVLKELGFVNAINLDGGGSATCVLNGTIVNYPSDTCCNSSWSFSREVSTVLCVHSARCSPDETCAGRGRCVSGQCQCRSPWSGDACDVLACPEDCGGHGLCLEDGCLCDAGWKGENCSLPCGQGSYGFNCSLPCRCLNDAVCHPVSGLCLCPPGLEGDFCQSACAYGFFGDGCRSKCVCTDTCFCDPVTGTCSNTSHSYDGYQEAWQCLAQLQIKRGMLVPGQSLYHCSSSSNMWVWTLVTGAAVLVVSLGLNVWLAVVLKTSRVQAPPDGGRLRAKRRAPPPVNPRQLRLYNNNSKNNNNSNNNNSNLSNSNHSNTNYEEGNSGSKSTRSSCEGCKDKNGNGNSYSHSCVWATDSVIVNFLADENKAFDKIKHIKKVS